MLHQLGGGPSDLGITAASREAKVTSLADEGCSDLAPLNEKVNQQGRVKVRRSGSGGRYPSDLAMHMTLRSRAVCLLTRRPGDLLTILGPSRGGRHEGHWTSSHAGGRVRQTLMTLWSEDPCRALRTAECCAFC